MCTIRMIYYILVAREQQQLSRTAAVYIKLGSTASCSQEEQDHIIIKIIIHDWLISVLFTLPC